MTVEERIEQVHRAKLAVPDPDTVPTPAGQAAARRKRRELTDREQILRAARTRQLTIDAEDAELRAVRAIYAAVENAFEDEITKTDLAAIRDLHERRRAEQRLEALHQAVTCLDLGFPYQDGCVLVPALLEPALTERGLRPLPGMRHVFDGRSGMRWLDAKLVSLRKERAQTQLTIVREVSAHEAATKS